MLEDWEDDDNDDDGGGGDDAEYDGDGDGDDDDGENDHGHDDDDMVMTIWYDLTTTAKFLPGSQEFRIILVQVAQVWTASHLRRSSFRSLVASWDSVL